MCCLNAMLLRLLLAGLVVPGMATRFATEKELCDHMLENYDNRYRPVKNSSHIVEVMMQLNVVQILNLDEKNQIMASQVSFLQIWKDEHLHWNSSDYDSQMLLTIPKSEIWGMDLYIKNSVGDTKNSLEPFHKNVQSYILVAEDGYCMSYYPYVLYTSCHMNTAQFPFDTQTCNITAGSWTYDTKQVNLRVAEPPILWWNDAARVGEWEFVGSETSLVETPYVVLIKGTPQTFYYDEITFSITVARNPGFYINNILVPTAMLAAVAIFSFLLPPESGERISLCLTTLLAIAVYAMVVADSVPESSKEVPLITRLLFLYMSIMAASTLWSVIATRFYYHAESYTAPPGWIMQWFAKLPSCPLRVSTKKQQPSTNDSGTQLMDINNLHQMHQVEPHPGNENTESQSQIVARWRQVIAGLDITFFVLFLLILVVGTLLFLM